MRTLAWTDYTKNKLIVVKASSKVDEMKKIILSCAVLACAVAPTFAQEVANEKKEITKAVTAAVAKNADEMKEVAKVADPVVEKVEVNQDGSFSGKVFAKIDNQETPVEAKVTLLSDGVVLDAVQTENGSFSFANIAPGAYTLTGTTTGFAGGQAFEVAPYAGTGCASCNLDLYSTSNVVHQDSAIYDAPVSACGSCGSSCGSCGGGFGGGGGIGRGLLRSRPLLTAGIIGGVVAIAVDDDDDSSADQ